MDGLKRGQCLFLIRSREFSPQKCHFHIYGRPLIVWSSWGPLIPGIPDPHGEKTKGTCHFTGAGIARSIRCGRSTWDWKNGKFLNGSTDRTIGKKPVDFFFNRKKHGAESCKPMVSELPGPFWSNLKRSRGERTTAPCLKNWGPG